MLVLGWAVAGLLYWVVLPFTPLCAARSYDVCIRRLGLGSSQGRCCSGEIIASARCPGLSSVRVTRRGLRGFCIEVSCPAGVRCARVGPCRRPEVLYCGHCIVVADCDGEVHVVDVLEGGLGPRFPWDCGDGLRVVNTVEGGRGCVALPRLRDALELLRRLCGLVAAEPIDIVYPYLVVRLASSSGLTYYMGAVLSPLEAPLAGLSAACPLASLQPIIGHGVVPEGGGVDAAEGVEVVIEEARVVGVGGAPRLLGILRLRGIIPYPWRLSCQGGCFGGFLDDWGRLVLSFGPEGGFMQLMYRGEPVEARVALACTRGRLGVHATGHVLVSVEPAAEEGCIPLVVISHGAGLVDSIEGIVVLRLTGSWRPLWPPGLRLHVEGIEGLEAWLGPRGLSLRCRGGYCVAACGDWGAAGAELYVPLGSAFQGCRVLVCGPGGCRGARIKPEETVAAAARLAVLLASEVSELAEDVAPNILDTRKLLDYASILDVLP